MNRFYQIAVSVLTIFSVGAVQAEIAPHTRLERFIRNRTMCFPIIMNKQ